MSAHQAVFPIATMARVLGVSKAGYYAWRHRSPSARAVADRMLMKRIRTIHVTSHETYGAPRIHAELRAAGEKHGRKRIARLMRAAGIVGVSRRRGTVVTTRRDKDARPAPDLVDRDFSASAPNQLWVADITFIPTAAGFLYLAVVLDAFSRRIVGWAMANHLRTELVLYERRLRFIRVIAVLGSGCGRDVTGDGPQKRRHLASDRGDHHGPLLAGGVEPAIASAQADCAFQVIARTALGRPSSRACRVWLTRAG
jgi:hypothetical protein